MKKPTQEELELLVNAFPAFVEETRHSISQLNKDLLDIGKKLDEVYLKVGASTNEAHILVGTVEKATDKIEAQTKQVKKSNEELQVEIAGSTRIITKEVDKPNKKWYQIWKKKEVNK